MIIMHTHKIMKMQGPRRLQMEIRLGFADYLRDLRTITITVTIASAIATLSRLDISCLSSEK